MFGIKRLMQFTADFQTKPMSKLKIKRGWNVAKSKSKQKWGKLTCDDLEFGADEDDGFIGRIERRLAEASDNVERALKQFDASQAG